jgi:hypothetical protein
MAKKINYTIYNNGKFPTLRACGSLSAASLGLPDNCCDSILIATAKAFLKSRFNKNKIIYVRIE